MSNSRRDVIVLGERWPAKAISYLEPIGEWDSGFYVVLEDAPEPDDVSDDEPTQLVCLECLIEEHPELGQGLDLAREHGEIEWDRERDGWVPV